MISRDYRRYATFSSGERIGTDVAIYGWAFIVARPPGNAFGWKDTKGLTKTRAAAEKRVETEVAASRSRGVAVTLAEIVEVIAA